ncbi:MAG: serine/threonine-protein kinase, partial [Defluviitaleaceae bacterium]|nr:serine/threonine-protein kinase [Defluviitaleaceae bacterium]
MADISDYAPLFNGWNIGNLLGVGGFGEVYEIQKETFGITQRSAIKRISISNERLSKDPKLLERVRTEIQTMIDMKGANHIVSIEEFDIIDWKKGSGRDILIRMELLTGLETIVAKKPLGFKETAELGIHICLVLELCEKRDIIHRDIKPANIFWSETGGYKLGDFGIARTLSDGKASTRIGTVEFMAPEVIGFRKYDNRADIYSLGITLYYLLNKNRIPFEGDDTDESPIVRRMDGEALPTLHNVPNGLMQIILKACAHKPQDRYMNAAEMRQALETCPMDISLIRRDSPSPSVAPIPKKAPVKKAPEIPKTPVSIDECYNKGQNYHYGRGVAKDYALAAEWYRKGAEQGDPRAQCNLGFLYSKGYGVAQDFKLAV